MFEFPGKTALVTGAGRRLGKETALALARANCNIIIHYNKSRKAAEETAHIAVGAGVKAWTLAADLCEPDEPESLISRAVEVGGAIDYLINAASIFPEGALLDLTSEELLRNMQINSLAPFTLIRDFAAQKREGAVVNFLDARYVDYDRKHVPYHLSKRMLFSLTRMLADELAPLIRVNAVAPGLILPPPGKDQSYLDELSGTNPLKTHGSAEQIAMTVLFLLWNTFVTGQVIFVDGGRNLKGRFYGD